MILNHKVAIEFVVENAGEIGLNPLTIRNLHTLLSLDLLDDPLATGRLRRVPVGISGSVFQPLSAPQLIEEYFNLLLAKADEVADPYEQAFFLMVHLPYLQPFDDVNKRVSRLAANIPLIQKNLAPISFTEVQSDDYVLGILGVYELQQIDLLRDIFIWSYERSAARYAAQRQSMGDPDPFRLRYRQAVQTIIGDLIRNRIPSSHAGKRLGNWARDYIPEVDRTRFIEMAEGELLGVGEGNFARYRVKPSEYYAWKQATW